MIGVNALQPKTRQRFAIAHEIAHLLPHSERELFVDRNFSVLWRDITSAHAVDPDEMAANTFAAELFMPASMLARGRTRGRRLRGRRVDRAARVRVSREQTGDDN